MARNLSPPHNLSLILDHVSGSLLTTSGAPKSPFFRRYWSWFPKKSWFFSFLGKFVKKWTLVCIHHPNFINSLFRKHLFRKVANVSNSVFPLIFMLLDRDHYPNFKFWFFRNFWSLKTLPLQFRTNSFGSDRALSERFYHKKCSFLIKFVRKLSLRALYRWWFDFHFFHKNACYRFFVLKYVIWYPNHWYWGTHWLPGRSLAPPQTRIVTFLNVIDVHFYS